MPEHRRHPLAPGAPAMNLTKILAGLLVGLAIVLAGLAWLLGSQPARPVAQPSPAASAQPAPEPVPQHAVVVVAQAIAAGQRIGSEDVKLAQLDRKSTRLNSSHLVISYAVFCLKKQQ